MVDREAMKAYSEDLRQKVVEAVEQHVTSKSEAARLFGISLSSVKRYTRLASEGEPLTPRKGGGRPPIADEVTKKMLEEDIRARSTATVKERHHFLERIVGKSPSEPALGRLLKRMGFSRKKRTVGALERDEGRRAAWEVMVAQSLDARRLVFVDEMSTNISLSPLYGWATKGQRVHCSVPRNRGKNTTLLASMSPEGMGPSLAVEGATTAAVFETYVERILAPSLRSGQVVVMDNLSAHKGEWVRELIEGLGCELLYLPSYSPDFNPIEEAFSKIKGLLRKGEAKTREALVEAIGAAILAVTTTDARGFFEHCGYRLHVDYCDRTADIWLRLLYGSIVLDCR